MLKKCFTFVLAMLMCSVMASTPVIATDVSTVETSQASTEITVSETTGETLPVTFQMLPDGDDQSRVWRTADGVYHIRATSEHMESYYGASDEALTGDTLTLLTEILEGRLMNEQIFARSLSLSAQPRTDVFSKHEGYQELLTRKDLLSAIIQYAKALPTGDDFDSLIKRSLFHIFLEQKEISALISGVAINFDSRIE